MKTYEVQFVKVITQTVEAYDAADAARIAKSRAANAQETKVLSIYEMVPNSPLPPAA